MRYTPGNITELADGEIFVFGSNLEGVHGKGAAKLAKMRFGAKNGQGEGFMGRSYGIPTRYILRKKFQTLGLREIDEYVMNFVEFAESRPDLTFLVTEIGCGLAGHNIEDIALIFLGTALPSNIILPKAFYDNDPRKKAHE